MIPRETVEKIFKKYGMKMALPDDPIYSESPSIHFINRPKKSTAGGNTLASKTKDSKGNKQESKKPQAVKTGKSIYHGLGNYPAHLPPIGSLIVTVPKPLKHSKKPSSDSTSSSSDPLQGRGLIQRHKGGNSNESTS